VTPVRLDRKFNKVSRNIKSINFGSIDFVLVNFEQAAVFEFRFKDLNQI
jgi:hypothetical protein